ncbi:MAG: DNA repair protein RecN [Saprospiraceae bacterium]
MITSLDIRNYALIDELHVDFANGLTIITGETGAGKSIILGGLGLIMGQRADTKALFDLKKKCIIEAHFQVTDYGLKDFFERNELDYDDELVIRREITPSGKTRAFVNDTPVKLSILQSLSRSLIDLHQQFDTLDIHNVSFQLRMIDALADNHKLLSQYAKAYKGYQSDLRKASRLHEQQEELRQQADYVSFQLAEFEAVDVQHGESEKLEQELKTLESSDDIQRVLGAAGTQMVDNEQAIVSQLRGLMPGVVALRGVNQKLDELVDRLDGLTYELEDTGQQLIAMAEDTESDTERLGEVNERLSMINKLLQKHSVTDTSQLLEIHEDFASRVSSHDQIDKEISSLEASIVVQRKVLTERALQLRQRRQKVVPHFLKKIHANLSKLSMGNAEIDIQFEPLENPGPTGLDVVEYLFSANKGSRLQPIKNVASGGELSRLTLVTKSLVASSIPLPTLIFDEIDSGVSGDVALRMGDILHELSANHQVVTITHSPQVASKADKHFFVYKEDLKTRTATRIRELAKQDRVNAIAVMLSCDPPSKPAIANARGLLATARP